MLTSLREQEVDPFNVHGRPIVIYRTEPTPLQVSDLGSLNFMTLVRHCKLRSQQPERQRERPYGHGHHALVVERRLKSHAFNTFVPHHVRFYNMKRTIRRLRRYYHSHTSSLICIGIIRNMFSRARLTC